MISTAESSSATWPEGWRTRASNQPAQDLASIIDRSGWRLNDEERGSLYSRLEDVLANGDFHYVVAAQRFTPTMQASLEYLNATMRYGRFFLVEVIQLEGGELVAHAAQVVAAPPKRSANTPSTWSRADEATFLQGIDDDGYRNAMRDIIAGCIPLGLTLEWGSRGASIRLSTPDRSEPLSIGWVLPEGAHWIGARNASFGVDPASLAATPSVAQAVTRYVDEIGKSQEHPPSQRSLCVPSRSVPTHCPLPTPGSSRRWPSS